MKRRIKRSPEYKKRIKELSAGIAEKYSPDLADVFLDAVAEAERTILGNNNIGKACPYIVLGEETLLREFLFWSGPIQYCLVFHIMDEFLELVTLFHSFEPRINSSLMRLWWKRTTLKL